MAISIVEGRAYRDGQEVFHLHPWELDQAIRQLYPDDKTLRTEREMAQKATSWTGLHFDNLDWIAQRQPEPQLGPAETCRLTEKLYELGGERLLTLYCNDFDFHATARDLGMQYGGIVKWWQRKRKELLSKGLRPEDLGLGIMLEK